MHRFLIGPGTHCEGRVLLSEAEAHHALKVLRLKSGDPVQALDGRGSAWEGTLEAEGDQVCIRLGKACETTEAPVNVTLYMGLPKGEKLELIAQKLTELGAVRLVPVRMERSVAKIPANEAEKKLSRVRRIAQEAQKQSGRQMELEIADPVDLAELPELMKAHDRCFLLWEEARGYRLTDGRAEAPDARDIGFIVGPEGGITVREAEKMEQAGAKYVTLGPRILRAETAAIAGCAAIMTLWGDL